MNKTATLGQHFKQKEVEKLNYSWSVWGTPSDFLKKEIGSIITQKPVVLCLGSSQILEDCLGPLVGTMLQKKGYAGYVYGTLDAPVSPQNLECAYQFVKMTHPSKKLLVVDASITKDHSRLGKIVLADRYTPLNPNLKQINLRADWFLFGVCNVCGEKNLLLAGGKLAVVEKLATSITNAILSIGTLNLENIVNSF